jgi:hypothetical protein
VCSRSFRGDTGVTPRRRFSAATRNHPHRACTSNPSTEKKLEPNRRVQKSAGKRAVSGLGAGVRWFESSRPDHFSRVPGFQRGSTHSALSGVTLRAVPIYRPLTVGSKVEAGPVGTLRPRRTHCSSISLTHSTNFPDTASRTGTYTGFERRGGRRGRAASRR